MTTPITDQHFVVLGLARQGLAVTRWLMEQGAQVTVSDSKPEADLQAPIGSLRDLSVASDDPRYLDLQVNVEGVEVSQDGKQAVVSGEVLLPADEAGPSELWVLAVAYGDNGAIVGARKWKSAGETHFEIGVYSLGGKIAKVEVLTEARP
jgi:hypothetical protein